MLIAALNSNRLAVQVSIDIHIPILYLFEREIEIEMWYERDMDSNLVSDSEIKEMEMWYGTKRGRERVGESKRDHKKGDR